MCIFFLFCFGFELKKRFSLWRLKGRSTYTLSTYRANRDDVLSLNNHANNQKSSLLYILTPAIISLSCTHIWRWHQFHLFREKINSTICFYVTLHIIVMLIRMKDFCGFDGKRNCVCVWYQLNSLLSSSTFNSTHHIRFEWMALKYPTDEQLTQ